MGFYEQNPGVKDTFAEAGGASSDSGTAPSSGNAPAAAPAPTDPYQAAIKAGMPDGELNLMFNPANADRPSGIPTGSSEGGTPPPTGLAFGNSTMPVGYDQGGAVDDNSDLNAALQAVNAAFDYGKQKHGLGGQQQASAIPMAPGTPSNSGAPRPLPMPGPLPPTNNPFGKRNNPMPAGAGQSSEASPDQEPDNDSDDETA